MHCYSNCQQNTVKGTRASCNVELYFLTAFSITADICIVLVQTQTIQCKKSFANIRGKQYVQLRYAFWVTGFLLQALVKALGIPAVSSGLQSLKAPLKILFSVRSNYINCDTDSGAAVLHGGNLNYKEQAGLKRQNELKERLGGSSCRWRRQMRTEKKEKETLQQPFLSVFTQYSTFLWRPGLACWAHEGRSKRACLEVVERN